MSVHGQTVSDAQDAIILASASPRRRELLTALGVPFRVVVADIDERVLAGEAPDALTTRLARTKALTVAGRLGAVGADAAGEAGARSGLVVLAADTVVAFEGTVLNKPADADQARAMLRALRGRTHQVYTGLAVAVGAAVRWCSVVETRVTMRPFGDAEIDRYVASGSPLDKAGGYGIQDGDFRPVERIEGCYANVVGLPLCEVRRALATIDADRARAAEWPASAGGTPRAGDLGCTCPAVGLR